MPRQGKRKRDQETGGTREGASDKRSQPPTDPDGNSIQFNFGVQPTENDIILGRGVLHVNHQGNARYYELLDAHMPAYDAAPTKGAKTKIVRSIFQQLQERRARFLKKDSKQGGLYHPITPKQAKKKISHAIRYRKRNQHDGDEVAEEEDNGSYSEDNEDQESTTRGLAMTSTLSREAGTGPNTTSLGSQIRERDDGTTLPGNHPFRGNIDATHGIDPSATTYPANMSNHTAPEPPFRQNITSAPASFGAEAFHTRERLPISLSPDIQGNLSGSSSNQVLNALVRSPADVPIEDLSPLDPLASLAEIHHEQNPFLQDMDQVELPEPRSLQEVMDLPSSLVSHSRTASFRSNSPSSSSKASSRASKKSNTSSDAFSCSI